MQTNQLVKVDHLIVSPHLDDAALSMGGHLLAWKDEKATSKVFTVFNSAQYARLSHGFSAIQKETDVALQQERAAMQRVGAQHEFLNLPEAGVRGYTPWNAPLDIEKDKTVIQEVTNALFPSFAVAKNVYFPLGTGREFIHPDHMLVCQIGVMLARGDIKVPSATGKESQAQNILFYEELPYATGFYEDTPYAVDKGPRNRVDQMRELMKTAGKTLTERRTPIQSGPKYDLLDMYSLKVYPRMLEATVAYGAREGERVWEVSPISSTRGTSLEPTPRPPNGSPACPQKKAGLQ